MKDKKTVGDQVAAYMQTNQLKPADMAALVNRCGAKGVKRQNIEQLTRNEVGLPRTYLQALAKAMRTTVDVLMAGRYTTGVQQPAPEALPSPSPTPPHAADDLLVALTVVAEALKPTNTIVRDSLEPAFINLVRTPEDVGTISQTILRLVTPESSIVQTEHNGGKGSAEWTHTVQSPESVKAHVKGISVPRKRNNK